MQKNSKSNIKPKRPYNSVKTSDRRLAAGSRPNLYLYSQRVPDEVPNDSMQMYGTLQRLKKQELTINPTTAVERIDPKTGKKWLDNTLVTWDPSHFRLFIGNIGPDVTEELLIRTFMKYPSLSKVKVPKYEKKNENKGFAFISFANSDDYLQCYREMNGKYVGSKPIELQKAKVEIGKTVKVKNKKKGKKPLV